MLTFLILFPNEAYCLNLNNQNSPVNLHCLMKSYEHYQI